jgi:CheY-like chemotaxis protein
MDPAQVDQILANLCVNARDAINGVGHILIRTANISVDHAFCTRHPDGVPGDYVRLSVEDDGCGMDTEIREKLFEPFFTTKAMGEGTGLGLSMIYGIIRQNNGFIGVASTPGKGTVFDIYLPRDTGPPVPDPEIGRRTTSGGTETILVVEDEAAILEMVRDMLENMGYQVLTANTPARALDIGKAHPDKISLLMTDVIMPEMNGKDLARRLTAAHPGLKTLFMSGYTADVIAHHGILEENVAFIQKPFSMNELAKRVRDVLDR